MGIIPTPRLTTAIIVIERPLKCINVASTLIQIRLPEFENDYVTNTVPRTFMYSTKINNNPFLFIMLSTQEIWIKLVSNL